MSLAALIALSQGLNKQLSEKFGGRIPRGRKIIGYSKGYWRVEYTFTESYGYSYEHRWEQDERSVAHHKEYPND